jgi:CheY-like chemotaxis protein
MEETATVGTVLLVEDDRSVRHTLRLWLSVSFPSLCMLEAQSGEEALTTAGEQPPDLVLMDYGLPGIDGLEAPRRLKATVPHALPVLPGGGR